jgi:cytidylate kinase
VTAARTVLLLVGPKGSGKTFIGSLISSHLGVHFLRAEPIFLANLQSSRLRGAARDAEGYDKVLAELERRLVQAPRVALESTGASEAFQPFLLALRARHRVLAISIRAPAGTCLHRVRTRDRRDHIAVSDDDVLEINGRAARVQLDWDLEIDNSGPAPADDILDAFRRLLAARG